MKLQILIAQYMEDEATIDPLLQSIALQQGLDFSEIGVLICNDGSDVVLSDEYLNRFPYQINYIQNDHRGVSKTRNTLLDASSAEYVMFCDADDMFYNALGLKAVFTAMKQSFDALISTFIEDVVIDENHVYMNRTNDTHFIHGKVFRRKYLIDNNIRWNDRFMFSGDTYFLNLALKTKGQFISCSMSFYLWRWNDDSICRREPNHFIKAYSVKMDVDAALIDEFISRNQIENAQIVMVESVYDAYFTMMKPQWSEQPRKDRQAKESQFRNIFNRYKEYFYNASFAVKSSIVATQRKNLELQGIYTQPVTFNEWIKSMAD